ncbi:MAG: DNA-directed RNA polymerase subunit alpha [Planctomycetota bacterium]|nr:DNA-directed RNA polymerase subunit alpha [Planctomycetota bacterium]
MRIRWRNFELPSKVQPDTGTLTESYGRFVIEPFERGFGHTIGTGLRRVLLSSISGSAVTSVRISGANHEFDSLEGVYEDIADLILNLKQLRVQYDGDEPIVCKIRRTDEGDVTGADVECPGNARVANPGLHLCTLTMDRDLEIDLEVQTGRGYVSSDENHSDIQELGTIPVDSVFSPVHRVRFAIEATRVGKFTNYDRLVLEIWTDGTLSPELALTESAKIYRKHLNPFVLYDSNFERDPLAENPQLSEYNSSNQKQSELQALLSLPVSELELSVRARNCLDGANLRTLLDVVSLSESEVMHLKNLGKTSLSEIKAKLADRGLSFGMSVEG